MALHLVSTEPPASTAPCLAPFSLRTQPQRPGEMCEGLVVHLAPATSLAVADQAHAEHLPAELVATVAVEAHRALSMRATSTCPSATLAAQLYEHAKPAPQRVLPAAGRRLSEYAIALRRGDPSLRGPGPAHSTPPTQFSLTPAVCLKAAWDLA